MKKLSLAIIACFGLSFGAFAQDTKTDNHDVTIVIQEVAILDIHSTGASKNITQTFTAPTEAGLALVAPPADATLWLNYSSIVTAAAPDNVRKVSVKISATVPGVNIQVAAATPTGTGTLGSGSTVTALSTTDQDIITAIGSCYTGDGASVGSNLTYTLTTLNADYGTLVAGTTPPVTVTYTLSDN